MELYGSDHYVDLPPGPTGGDAKHCDGVLINDKVLAFVEFKSRNENGPKWVKDAGQQLLATTEKLQKRM